MLQVETETYVKHKQYLLPAYQLTAEPRSLQWYQQRWFALEWAPKMKKRISTDCVLLCAMRASNKVNLFWYLVLKKEIFYSQE